MTVSSSFHRQLHRCTMALAALLALALLGGCTTSPFSAGAETSPVTETSAGADAGALLQAATTPGGGVEGVHSPAAQSAAGSSSDSTGDSSGDSSGDPSGDTASGPVPPMAPVAIGDSVTPFAPTPIFLPTITNAGAGPLADSASGTGAVTGSTIPAPELAPDLASGGDVSPPNAELVDTPAGPAFSWQDTENFLILGTDRRASEGSWRTDSIMVVGLDRVNNRAAVFSIPRDLYVNIPGYGWGRINQADYMGERRDENGGPALVGEIVERELGIPTQHFVRIQMDGFVDFVDALGGVNIYLDCPFSEPIFNLTTQSWTRFSLPAGENHLDGEDAYWFSRLRLEGTDIGRSSRQRAIIWAMRDQILSTNALLRLPELYTAFNDTISTDLGLFDIISLAQTALSLDASNVRASGLTLRDLQNFVTDGGAQVLVIGSPERVRSLVEGVWDAPAMANAFRGKVAGCPEVAPDEQGNALPDQDALAGESLTGENLTGENLTGENLTGTAGTAALPDIITDPVTGQQFDAVTGFPIDPTTGLPIDPATGDPATP